MKFLLLLSTFFILPHAVFAETNQTCQQAMDQTIKSWAPEFKYISVTTTAIGDEPLVEATAIVVTWIPRSETNSVYYIQVSATCVLGRNASTDLNEMKLWTDMPSEGGVKMKVISKRRY